MDSIRVIYSRNNNATSLGIRLFDRQGGQMCPYSHVGVISPCGKFVYESTAKEGVVKTPIADFYARYDKVYEGVMPCDSEKLAFARLEAQLGKSYDYFGVISLGIPFIGRNWQRTDKWWCSELVAHATGLFRKGHVRVIGVAFCFALTKRA